MNKNLSDKNRMSGNHETTKGEKQVSRNEGLKFVSDEDIVGRSTAPKRNVPIERQDGEPKFVSDEDIVRRPAA